MAEITDIYNSGPVAKLPPQPPNPLLELFRSLMEQQASTGQAPANLPQVQDQLLEQQGANVRTADLSSSQVPIVQQLIGNQVKYGNPTIDAPMTKGLSPTLYNGGNETGLTYSGGVAGRAGPPLPGDSEPIRTYRSRDQKGFDAGVEAERLGAMAGPGGMTMRDIMERLGATKSMGPSSYGAVNQMIKEGKLPKGLEQTDPTETKLEAAMMKGALARENRDAVASQRAQDNLYKYFNRKTGMSAADDFPAGAPDLATLNRDYIQLGTEGARNQVNALKSLDTQIQNYEQLIKELPLSDKNDTAGMIISGFNIKGARKGMGDAKHVEAVRALEAVKAQIMSLARGLGGNTRTADSEKELARLEGAVIGDWDTKANAQRAVDTLKNFRDNNARNVPIPGLRNRYSGNQPQGAGAPQAGGISPERRKELEDKYGVKQ